MMSTYESLLRPLLFGLPAEAAHDATVRLLSWTGGCAPCRATPGVLRQTVLGQPFDVPVGIAAGLDKNGVAIDGLAALGVSHVEIGTVTGLPQPGNPKPRLFRLPQDRAIINRMGFNNRGAAWVADHLAARMDPAGGRRRPATRLGINLGKSKVVDLAHAADDYRASVARLAPFADYLVVNVSSPNTPGLRDLQDEARLRPLLIAVRAAVDAARPAGCPLLLKIAPDLADAGIDAAVEVAVEAGFDGLIATNTTIGRGGLSTDAAEVTNIGAGGLSGDPLAARSTQVLARVKRRLRALGKDAMPVIGVGGIASAATAWDKVIHGASLVQVYSGLVYRGPDLIAEIVDGLAERCQRAGVRSIADAVGSAL